VVTRISIVEYFKYISVSKPKTTTITEKLISSIEKGQLLSEEQSIKNNNLHIINI
jgi:predicted glycosyltransferase